MFLTSIQLINSTINFWLHKDSPIPSVFRTHILAMNHQSHQRLLVGPVRRCGQIRLCRNISDFFQ